ncbi:hypothetical protein AOLI_G00166820 [Acnodon oligacanthus]
MLSLFSLEKYHIVIHIRNQVFKCHAVAFRHTAHPYCELGTIHLVTSQRSDLLSGLRLRPRSAVSGLPLLLIIRTGNKTATMMRTHTVTYKHERRAFKTTSALAEKADSTEDVLTAPLVTDLHLLLC